MFKIAFSEKYVHQLPKKHRFPMLKYELLPKQLMHEGIGVRKLFFPEDALEKDILAVHNNNYWDRFDST